MSVLGSLTVKLGIDPAQFRAGLVTARTELSTFKTGIDGSSRDISKLGDALSSVGRVSSLASLAGSAVSLVSALRPAAGAVLGLPAGALAAAGAYATLKVGTSGLGAALTALASGNAAQADAALKALSPTAQKFALSLNSVRTQYGALKSVVSTDLLKGLDVDAKSLGSTYLPILEAGLGNTALSLNGMADSAVKAASTPFFTGAVNNILAKTSGILNTMRPAAGAALTSIVALAQGGLPLLQTGAGIVTTWLNAKAAFLSSAAGADWMRQKVDAAQATLKQMWAIARNIAAGLGGIFNGASASGASLLTTIQNLTARFATWSKSAEGQQKIQQLFQSLTDLAAQLLVLIPQIAGPLGKVLGVFTSLPGPVQDIIGKTLAWSLMIGKLTSAFSPLIAVLDKVGLKALASAAKMAASWLIAMGPIGWAIAAVIALVAIIIWKWDAIKAATVAAWNWITGTVSGAWDAIWGAVSGGVGRVVGLITGAWDDVRNGAVAAWNWITGTVSGAWDAIWGAVSRGIDAVVGLAASIGGRILGALGDLGSLLYDAGANVIRGLINGIKSMVGSVGNAVSSIASTIRSYLPFSPAKRGPLSGAGAPNLAGSKIATMLSSGMLAELPSIMAASDRLAGAINLPTGGQFGAIPAPRGVGAVAGSAGAGGPIQLEFRSSGTPLEDLFVSTLAKGLRAKGGNIDILLKPR